jgi:thiamine transport system permease protein
MNAMQQTSTSFKTSRWAVLMWLMPLMFLIVMLAVPFGSILFDSFLGEGRFGLDTLIEVVSEPYFQNVAKFTVYQALLSTLVSVVLGVFWAFVLVRYEFPFKRTIQALSIVPFVLPAVSLALGFILVYGREGFLNDVLGWLGMGEFRLLYSLPAIVLAHAFYNAPIVARMTHAAWERIDPGYEESASSMGANPIKVFLTVTLPLLVPGIVTGTALAFIYSFLSFPIVLILGGAVRFDTLEVAIYTETIVNRNIDFGAAIAFVQVTLSLGFTAGYLWLERRFAQRLETFSERRTVPLFADWMSPLRWLLWLALAIGLLFFISPIMGVLIHSFQTLHGDWSLDGYRAVFASDFNATIGNSPIASVINSLQFALAAMVLSLLLGLPLALAIVRRRLKWLNTFAMMPLAISSVALGFGLLRAFASEPFNQLDRGVAIVMAHTLLALPFVVRALVPALRGLDIALSEVAQSLGAPPVRVFLSIELPLLRKALLVGAAFAFAISIGEMSATILLAGPNQKTMPLVVHRFLSDRQFYSAASAMSALLMLTTAISFVLLELSGRRMISWGHPR